MELKLLILTESAELHLLKFRLHFYDCVSSTLSVTTTLVIKSTQKCLLKLNGHLGISFLFLTSCISFRLISLQTLVAPFIWQCRTPGNSAAHHLAQTFKVSCAVAWQKQTCKMLVLNIWYLREKYWVSQRNNWETSEGPLLDKYYFFQGVNHRRTQNAISLSRDDFSDSIIFLCCKTTHSSLLFIILFTAIRHFPIYFTLLCNFFWQLISLFDSWPVMASLFFEMFVYFFPSPEDVSTYYHRCIRPISHFFSGDIQ